MAVVTDTIADMLTRIRNANSMGYTDVTVPASKLKIELARILKEEGFIKEYKVVEYEGNGAPKYRVATANIGFIGKSQTQVPESLTLNDGTVNVLLYKAINDLTELSAVGN